MIGKFHIIEIIKDGHRSLYTDIDGYVRSKLSKILMFDILPLLIALLMVFLSNFSEKLSSFSSDILTGISIFSGLLFSVIIVIVDKAKVRKAEMIDNKNDEIKIHLSKYLLFSEQLVSQISLAIFTSFLVIISLISSLISIQNIDIPVFIIESLSFLGVVSIIYFSIQFFILLLVIISGMYSIFVSEISN